MRKKEKEQEARFRTERMKLFFRLFRLNLNRHVGINVRSIKRAFANPFAAQVPIDLCHDVSSTRRNESCFL